jgi:hypothetical protein
VLPHGEIMRLVAERMGLSPPAPRESDEQIAASALPDGVDLEALKADGWHKTFPPRPTFDASAPAFRIAGFTLGDASRSAGPMLQLLTPKSHYFLNSSFGNTPHIREAWSARRSRCIPRMRERGDSRTAIA